MPPFPQLTRTDINSKHVEVVALGVNAIEPAATSHDVAEQEMSTQDGAVVAVGAFEAFGVVGAVGSGSATHRKVSRDTTRRQRLCFIASRTETDVWSPE